MDWHRELVVPLCAEILVAANLKFGSCAAAFELYHEHSPHFFICCE